MAENTFEKILTPQEHLFLGSGTLLEESQGAGVNWHKPEAVSEGTVRDVSLRRQKTAWYEGSMLGILVGVPHIAIKLSELDPKTGETLSDPVLGVRDEEADEYIERPDLTELMYKKLKEAGIDPHLREQPTEIEHEPGGERKG